MQVPKEVIEMAWAGESDTHWAGGGGGLGRHGKGAAQKALETAQVVPLGKSPPDKQRTFLKADRPRGWYREDETLTMPAPYNAHTFGYNYSKIFLELEGMQACRKHLSMMTADNNALYRF